MSTKPILMNTEMDLMQEPGAFYNGIIANITDEAIEFENRCMGEALRRWQISKEDVLAKIREADKLRAENEKLRAELEQIPSCIYYKQGGLCRYGGDDPANVCVLGPCPHERTAEEVLADLARVTAERDAAVKDMEALMWFSGEGCHICAHEIIIHKEPYVRSECALGNCAACCPTWRGPQKED